MDGFTADLVGRLTAGSLLLIVVAWIVWAFISGRIRPRSAVDEIRADRDARVAEIREERDTWREAHRLSETAREKNEASLREALEVARAAEDALKGFRVAAAYANGDRGDGPT